MVGTRGRGRRNGRCRSKVQIFSYTGELSSEDLKYSMVATTSNTVLRAWKLLRVDLMCSPPTRAHTHMHTCACTHAHMHTHAHTHRVSEVMNV